MARRQILPTRSPATTMQPIPIYSALTPESFRDEIVPASRPVVLRGLVRDWPVVAAARQSPAGFCDYLRRFDRGYGINTAYGPPSIRGRLFYNEDMSGLNCRMGKSPLSSSLDYLQQHADDDPAPTLAIQSVVISRYLPGMERDNPSPAGIVPDGIDGRLWLGSRSTVAAHFDPSENIACCVAGKRRFTLFPPEQVTNLYIGPFELTPAGATISLVDFDAPDYEAYPRFRDAEKAAFVADVEPGDAVYIPYLWWHHVRSVDRINGLVNYWWANAEELRGDPRNAMMHAMMSIASLPPAHRKAWRAMFDHYVFRTGGEIAEHLPENRRGVMGDMKADDLKKLRLALSRMLSRN